MAQSTAVAPQRRSRRHAEPALYDARYEHDACGVGFVADAGGRSGSRILALALGGLAALGHRGAFAADGASSDGAGILLPITTSLLAVIDPRGRAGARPGVLTVFAPVAPRAVRRPARLPIRRAISWALRCDIRGDIATRGRSSRRRSRPRACRLPSGAPCPWIRPRSVARQAQRCPASSTPSFRGPPTRPTRRSSLPSPAPVAVPMPPGAPPACPGSRSVSASSRTIVYKGLVAGDRLARFYPDLAAPIDVPLAVFHQRYATNTHPTWSLAQPFGFVAHNGEINTVRGNREAVRGRERDGRIPARRRVAADRLRAAGPLLTPDASDSQSLDEALELLVGTGWSLEAALLALVPEASALRRTPHPAVAAFRRRVAGFVAPWDGPAAFVFSDGRRVGALLDRNGLRPAAWSETADGVVAVASEAGAVPLDPDEIVRSGRLGARRAAAGGPPRGPRSSGDSDAKSWVLRRLPLHDASRVPFADADDPARAWRSWIRPRAVGPRSRPVAGGGAAEPARPERPGDGRPVPPTEPGCATCSGSTPSGCASTCGRWRSTRTSPCGAWATTRRSPVAAGSTRPVADHLRQAFAQVTNPPIDPERERAVMDLADASSAAGRRSSAGCRAGPATVRVDAARGRGPGGAPGRGPCGSRAPHRAVRILDATWPRGRRVRGTRCRARPARRRGARCVAGRVRRSIVLSRTRAPRWPSRAGCRCRPCSPRVPSTPPSPRPACAAGRTSSLDAGESLDVHGLAMVVAAGARRRPSPAAARARARAGGHPRRRAGDPGEAGGQHAGRARRRASQGARADGHLDGRQLRRRPAVRDARAGSEPGRAAASRPPRRGRAGSRRAISPRSQLSRLAARPRPGRSRPAGPAARSGLRPVPRRRRAAPVQPGDRKRAAGPGDGLR